MRTETRAVLRATLTMIGTIIGAGVFALPVLFARVGLLPATVLFLFVTGIVLATHVLYLEIALAIKKRMRLTGYARQELGSLGSWVAMWTYPLQIMGADFAYLLLGGGFLATLVGRWFPTIALSAWTVLFWAIGALVVARGLRGVAKIEGVATWMLIITMAIASLVTLHGFDLSLAINERWSEVAMPFGAFLFALSGYNAVHEVSELVGRKRERAMAAVVLGTLIAAALSWFFAVGIAFTGGDTDRLPNHLAHLFPSGIGWIIPLIGLLAVITSYFIMAEDLTIAMEIDFGMKKTAAWLVTFLTPLALVFIVHQDFLHVVGAVGALFGGLNGIMIALIAWKLKAQRRIRAPLTRTLASVVLVAFVVGIVYQLVAL